VDKELLKKSQSLEILEMDDQIESKRLSIAEKKGIESELKKKYGRDWKKILGIIKVDKETLNDLYAIDPSLRDLSRPGGMRRA